MNPRRPDLANRSSISERIQSGEIEQVVTNLLRTTKSLLEALTQWSQLRASVKDIIDYRETLDRQFITVSQAFDEVGVPMNDLAWIPHQLKDSIAAALKEEPSPVTLEQHLPRIRDVIVHLLQGLKGKQQQLRDRDATWSRESRRRDSQQPTGYQPRPPYPPGNASPPPGSRMSMPEYNPRMGGMPQPSAAMENQHMYPPPGFTANTGHYPVHQHSPTMMPTLRSSSSSVSDGPSPLGSPVRPTYTTQPTPPVEVHVVPPPVGPAPIVSAPAPPPPPPPPPPPILLSPVPSAIPIQGGFDESDPQTASAIEALKRQENLARRSSVRRTTLNRGNSRTGSLKRSELKTSTSSASSRREPSKLSIVEEATDTPEPTVKDDKDDHKDNKDSTGETGLTLFLQIGQDVKKIQYTGEVTIPALRMLFIERFGYSSGQEDFPSIYIRDHDTKIAYELEDLGEVQNKSILSLNVKEEPKPSSEQSSDAWIKQITSNFEKELGEMSSLLMREIDSVRQQVLELPKVSAPPPAPSPPPLPAQQEPEPSPVAQVPVVPILSADQVREQLKELESLRRDMAVLRQLQREMSQGAESAVNELKERSKALREQQAAAKETSTAKSAARQFIEEGKEKIQTTSQDITHRLQDLQDTVDELKLDVTQRKCRPSEAQLSHCRRERTALMEDISSFANYISTVKPRWKKTWEEELQTIVKEQQLIKDNESLLVDLRDDLDALVEMFEQIERFCEYLARSRPVVREYNVLPAEEGFQGMTSVLKQVASIDVDHDRRLKALSQAERMRQRELANRIDEFEQELVSFVGSSKLKKTGGAEEVERLRQQKDKDMLKQMYAKNQDHPDNTTEQ